MEGLHSTKYWTRLGFEIDVWNPFQPCIHSDLRCPPLVLCARALAPVACLVVLPIRRHAHRARLAVVSAAVSGVRREWQPEPRHHRRRRLRTRDRELRALMRWECCGVRNSLCYGQVRSSLCYGRVRTGASC